MRRAAWMGREGMCEVRGVDGVIFWLSAVCASTSVKWRRLGCITISVLGARANGYCEKDRKVHKVSLSV